MILALRYQLDTLRYDGRTSNVILVARDENNRKCRIRAVGFRPYFYVKEGEEIPSSPLITGTEYGFKSIFGDNLIKIYTSQPSDVPKLRESFSWVGEADIPFLRRFLIDTGITSGFEIPYNRTAINWRDIKPVNTAFPLIYVVMDIEVQTKHRFPDVSNPTDPIVAISFYDTISEKFVTIVLDSIDSREWWSPTHLVIRVTTEVSLFETAISYLKRVDPDVILGWNIFFDLDYFRARGSRLKVSTLIIDECAHLDLLSGYKNIFRKASNHLKDVVLDEGIDSTVLVEGYKLYDTNRDLFIEYSMKDVLYPLKLNESHGLLSYYHHFKVFTGLEKYSATMSQGTKVDIVMLRDAFQHHEVLPSKPSYDDDNYDRESYEGAIVFEPSPGIKHDVGVFDMTRFYPSIMLAYHLSPERRDGTGIYERVIRRFFQLRDEYDKHLDVAMREFGPKAPETKSIKEERQVVKDLLNAVYGYAGYKGSRLYNKDIAAAVTLHAREALLFIKSTVEKLGFNVSYGDTDSLVMNVPFEKCKEVEQKINESLHQYSLDLGIEPLLRIKFEKYYKTVVWTEVKSGERGAKKRYCARCIWEDEKDVDYTIIKGYERRDTSKVGMKIMKSIIDMILYDRIPEIKNYVLDEVSKIRSGAYKFEDIAMTTTFHQNLDSYKSAVGFLAPFIRGANWSNKYLNLGITGGDTVKMLPVLRVPGYPPTDSICFINESDVPEGTVVNVNELLRISVQNKIESFLRVCGLSWLELSSTKTLSKVFG